MSETATIILSNGLTAIIDAADFDLLSAVKWRPKKENHTTYAYRNFPRQRGRALSMHRFLLGEPPSRIDHINGNGLDNRRANLRLATASQNAWHARRKNGKSGFRGVHPNSRGTFSVRLQVYKKQIRLGTYSDPIEAAKAYDRGALEHFGEFAVLNFSTTPTTEK